MDNEFQIKQRSPVFWIMQADRLRLAADIIFKKYKKDCKKIGRTDPKKLKYIELSGIATMLYGYSMENLIKALRLRCGLQPLNIHNQIKLIEGTEFTCSAEEQDLINKLSSFTSWKGKYGTPLYETEMLINYESENKKYNPKVMRFGKYMILPINEIEKKLYNKTYSKIRDLL